MGMKWTCRDGRILDIKEMHEAHIKNCIAMMRREGHCSMREFCNAVTFANLLGGELAREAAAEEISRMNPISAIDILEDELARRDNDIS
jgi:hypothetical protein